MKKLVKRPRGPRFHQTLLTRYLLIILFAFLFIPIIFPLASFVYMLTEEYTSSRNEDYLKYGDGSTLEAMWHQEASQLDEETPEQTDRKLQEMKRNYPEGSFFWVDASGETQLQLPRQEQLPERWTHADAIRYMKKHIDGDPYTVVAFIGPDNSGAGFMVMQLPRSLIQLSTPVGAGTPFYIAFLFIMFAFFVLLSLLFFRQIRRRLLRLQSAMKVHGSDGLPMPIVQKKQDEIGELEAAFNEMTDQLRGSKERESAEEELRKRLIANLSHDLRTPLTVMNSHAYSLRGEALSEHGKAAVKQLEQKIASLGSLIENLLSYTLMTGGRYPLKLEQLDVLRLVRESAAAWYPLWEQEGIEPDIDLPGEPIIWRVDKEGFRRVLDNLFQNIVRHAHNGQYIGLSSETREGQTALVISDRGAGMESESSGKGAGIGLAIVEYLIAEMELEWRTESTANSTRISIFPRQLQT
ncbi:sensor histidine kinase [Paenibacillus harenae]|uniref:sensor histidine kinase n=1 Tax=Paenibacillus harenae TaxID=306543 RepID=UPI0004172B83|nr:HAMP domain-containing sensor histidine kinase [Paenibacillus harenae]